MNRTTIVMNFAVHIFRITEFLSTSKRFSQAFPHLHGPLQILDDIKGIISVEKSVREIIARTETCLTATERTYTNSKCDFNRVIKILL